MPIDPNILVQLTDSPTSISVQKLIGDDNFRQLSIELGGSQLYIPSAPSEGCPLAVCIGIDAAKKMAEVWGGMEFEVPVRIRQKERIKQMLAAGIPVVRISAHIGIAIRTVRRVANEETDSNQLPLPLSDA